MHIAIGNHTVTYIFIFHLFINRGCYHLTPYIIIIILGWGILVMGYLVLVPWIVKVFYTRNKPVSYISCVFV